MGGCEARRAARRPLTLTNAEARQALSDGAPTDGGAHPGKVVGEGFVELRNAIAAFEPRGIILRDLDSGYAGRWPL